MPIYDENAPLLVERGYFPLPIAPIGFQPAKVPVRNIPSLGGYHLLAGWNTRSRPIDTPQPGANIGVRCGNGLVAFDFDDEDAALAISEAFDASPVNKAGKRAWTPFYRADFEVPSEDFFDPEGRKVLQILSTGRQTVLPPSIHPDTNEPYRWTNGRSLYDTPLSELPLLPRDYRERILAIGYVSAHQPDAAYPSGIGKRRSAPTVFVRQSLYARDRQRHNRNRRNGQVNARHDRVDQHGHWAGFAGKRKIQGAAQILVP